MNNSTDPASPAPQPLDNSLQSETISGPTFGQSPVKGEVLGQEVLAPKPPRHIPWTRIAGILLLIIGLSVGTFVALHFIKVSNKPVASEEASSKIKTQDVQLANLSQQLEASSAQSAKLTVNGQLLVGNSLVLQPTSQPNNPLSGQIYYDQNNNNLAFYNGSQFINLLGSTVNTQIINSPVINTTNVTNIVNAAGGVTAKGTPGTIAMFTASGLGDSQIAQSGATINVGSTGTTDTVALEAANLQLGSSNADHTIQLGSGNGVQNVTVGSQSASSSTTIQGGTGNVAISTGAVSGVSGNVSITTGDSSTTAAGNITIDNGHSVIAGELIEDKTFETGLDNMNAWFGDTVAQSSAQAHSGTYSLAASVNAANWGIIETLPGVSVTAGHQYYFSMWVRAGSTSRTISASAVWNGAPGTVALTPVNDNSTGWTEITGLGVAPGGATSVYLRAQSIGTAGEVHYFDDMTVTDLSSSSSAAVINIGNTNAKIITIGNANQIGATTINGGSGINLNSGAAGITLTGGVMSITGTAPSTIATTSGALTLSSEATASWGVGTAGAGLGGDLTLHAGRGGTDGNNNGGNLFLQGGAPNGTGTIGSVIVKPQADSSNAFQIQKSAGTPFFVADSSNMTIDVTGTDTAYATLHLGDAHIKATQTTPPSIAAPTNCGTGATAAITAGSTDTAGSFTITTGASGAPTTCDAVVTFHQTYGAAPKTILVIGKTDAVSAARQIYVSNTTPTNFTTSFGVSSGTNSATYSFSYFVIE